MRFHTSQRAGIFFGFFWASAHGDSEVWRAMRYGTHSRRQAFAASVGRASELMMWTTSNLGKLAPNHPRSAIAARRDYSTEGTIV